MKIIILLILSFILTFSIQAKDFNCQKAIDVLNLKPHIEGGFYIRTYESGKNMETESVTRKSMSSIYYMLTKESPIGYFHYNKSDIIHYFHEGSPVNYYVISQDGKLNSYVLGKDLKNGQQFQLVVKGGSWKASELISGDCALISEAVSPGFDFNDQKLATKEFFMNHYKEFYQNLQKFIKE